MIVSAVPLVIGLHPTIIAQRVGDEAYDRTLAETNDGNQAAVAYHRAVRAVYDRYGYAPCECSMCELADTEPGVEQPANHTADLMGW